MKLFPVKNLWAGATVIVTSMTSKGTGEMSPANIGRFEIYSHKFVDKSFFLGLYFTKHSMTGLKGNSSFCFPRISVYPYAEGLLLIHYVANCKLYYLCVGEFPWLEHMRHKTFDFQP